MKKKLIGLSILLLVLLLGSFSTCYASVYIEWTDIQLKNIIYKMAMNYNANYSSAYVNLINSKSSEIQTIVNDLNNNRYVAIGAVSDNSTLFVKITDVDNGWYVYRNQPVLFGGSWYKVYTINISSNSISISSNTSDNSSSWIWGDYMYIGRNTFTNTSFTTKKWSGNTHIPDNFFDEWYWTSSVPFGFVPKPADSSADVYYFEDVPLYNASGEDLYIGQLFVPSDSNITYWTKDNYYYRYNDWNLRQLSSDSLYLDFYTTDNDVVVYDVYLKSNFIFENTIYSSVWADGSTEPYTLAIGNFYIKNNNTVVVNGAIDINSTFSGDYKDKYDNDIDNQEDVSNIIAGTEPILDFLTNTNIPSGEEPTFSDLPSIEIDDDSEEFFTWLLSSFLSVLNNNSNTNLTIPLFNNNYTIPSNFFVLNIEPLRTFINLGWWFICGVPFLKFIRSSIEKLKGGNIPLADEKSDLLGHII